MRNIRGINDLMNDKLTETIRIRLDDPLRKKIEKIAAKMTSQLPPGSRRITLADVGRIALRKFVGNGK